MPPQSLDRLLSQLESTKHQFDTKGAAHTERLLGRLAARNLNDPDSLIRFHELLLFIRAHPANSRILNLADGLLSSFAKRVQKLAQSHTDVTEFDYIEYSGIAGTVLSGTFSYGIAQWLLDRYPAQTEIDWEHYETKQRLGLTLPRILPLLYEEALVEANIPYLTWLRSANPASSDLRFLVEGFNGLEMDHRAKAELFELTELPIRWTLENSRASRTNNRSRPRRVFYHRGPMLKRSEVSLDAEISGPPLNLELLSRHDGDKLLDRVKETTTVRYRELYGITNGDPSTVVRTDVGRGVEMFLWGLPPDRRLPIRAYHAGFTLKNGVPINYIEAISLFDRAELGFNTFYTYRDGESAWVYAQALRLLHHVLGINVFSIDPYQIGFNNEEAIESGAFWFYRKLGFRPTLRDLRRIVEREESKLSRDRAYRTSARVLRRLSRGHIVYEIPSATPHSWDGFHIRNLGLAVQRRIAQTFSGNKNAMLSESVLQISKALRLNPGRLNRVERRALEQLSLVLSLITDLKDWRPDEKRRTAQAILAKSGSNEARYLRTLQSHMRLREAIRLLGSDSPREGSQAVRV